MGSFGGPHGIDPRSPETPPSKSPDLFSPAGSHGLDWVTGPNEWRANARESRFEGMEGYLHLVRAPDDPERTSREERKRLGIREVAPHKRLDKTSVSEWRRLIRKHLHDRGASTGAPSADKRKQILHEFTFNRTMVELAGVTADIAFGTNADRALWSLVHDGILEHTVEAPVRFRLSDPFEIIEDVSAYLDGDGVWRCDECHEPVPVNRWTQGVEDCPRCRS